MIYFCDMLEYKLLIYIYLLIDYQKSLGMSGININVDVVFLEDGTLNFIIKQNSLEMIYHISCPMKYGISIWQQIRDSKHGGLHYDGSKMADRTEYNITVLFNEKLGTSQHIRSNAGILEFAIEIDRGNKICYSLMSVKVPIETCYDSIDKIIAKYKK